jgi:hypothetical protein
MAHSLLIGANDALAFEGALVIWQVGVNRIASESALQPPRVPPESKTFLINVDTREASGKIGR